MSSSVDWLGGTTPTTSEDSPLGSPSLLVLNVKNLSSLLELLFPSAVLALSLSVLLVVESTVMLDAARSPLNVTVV